VYLGSDMGDIMNEDVDAVLRWAGGGCGLDGARAMQL
jgi:hypothetical protein